jgi:hypothetical protein
MHCIVCGKEIEHPVKLPHGKLNLCSGSQCIRTVIWESEKSLPLVWVGVEDFKEHEMITDRTDLKELSALPAEEFGKLVDHMADYLWDDGMFGEMYNGLLEYGAQLNEYRKIDKMEKKLLPTLIGHVQFSENKKYLEERMKEL